MNALEITRLEKHFKDFSLEDITMTLPAGCIMGVVGENGAGKSTTIKLIMNLLHRDAGDVCVLGVPLTADENALKEHIGVVMDESSFPENLTAKNIDHIMKNCYKTWDAKKFAEYLHRFTLPEGKRVKEYSRGMKMKLAIAVAPSHDSRLLILDEATSGLDPFVREELLDVFLDFIQDETHSIFISSHIVGDLEKICDYIAFLHKGRLVFCQTKDELLETYALVKCGEAEYEDFDNTAVIGRRKHEFGMQVLMKRDGLPEGCLWDAPSLEDIMIYHVRGVEL